MKQARALPLSDRPARALREVLAASLTDEERERALAGALLVLDKPGRQRLCQWLGPRTGRTLAQLLEDRTTHPTVEPSADKVEQEWKQAWWAWDAIIDETTDPEGRYVRREVDSTRTYLLDVDMLARDLDVAARRIRQWIPWVWEVTLAARFDFARKLVESVRAIGAEFGRGLRVPDEGIPLGPEVTAALLEWEWRRQRDKGGDAFAFVDRLRSLQEGILPDTGVSASLDEKTLVDFVMALPVDDQRAVYRGLVLRRGRDPWRRALQSPWSPWSRMERSLRTRFGRVKTDVTTTRSRARRGH